MPFGRLVRWLGAGRSRGGAPGAAVSGGDATAAADAPASPAAWLVVGLSNPGVRYAGTRHNAGADAVERLAADVGARFGRTRHGAHVAEAVVAGQRVVLALPQTFMNRSGDAVAPLLRELGLPPDRLLVVVDDLSLPLGALRLRAKGSPGGHNGLRSIDDALAAMATASSAGDESAGDEATGDEATAFADYPRLRVGIGNSFAPGFQAEFVLSRFEPEERAAADATFARAAEAVRTVVDGGVAAAMTTVNRRS